MKVLMLVNWPLHFLERDDHDIQSPDKVVKDKPYWFFRYLPVDWQVDVIGINARPAWFYRFEKDILRFYIRQPLSILSKSEQCDLILSHGSQSSLVFSMLRKLKKRKKARHVVIDVGCMNGGKESGLSLQLVKSAAKELDGIIYHASIQKRFYQKYLPWLIDKAFFIPFGVQTDFYYPNPKKTEENFILSFGSIKRDYHTLIESAKMLPGINFKIIGPQKLEDELPLNVELISRVPAITLRDYLWKAKLIVLPLPVFNYAYGQMSLLQSMVCEKCVIATKTPSTIDYIEDLKTGIFVKPSDAGDLKEKIEMVWKNEMMRKKIAQAGLEAVKTKFNEERMAHGIYEVIRKVIGEP